MIECEVYRQGVLLKHERTKAIPDIRSDPHLQILQRIYDDYIKELDVKEFTIYLNDGVDVFFESVAGTYEVYASMYQK